MRIASGQLAASRSGASAYVPGCGRGHDAVALAKAGWQVTAIDVVAELADDLSAKLEPFGGCFIVGDALAPQAKAFDLIWEHTFLCALDPDQRQAWAAMVQSSLAPGGQLAVLIFPANKGPEAGGPPWGYTASDLEKLLGSDFELQESAAVDPELEPRNWDQRFALFRYGG
ncbi:MAG: SAM-dependent methyltransferase [Planctomycetota bacterium]